VDEVAEQELAVVDREVEAREVRLAADCGDQRRYQVFDQRGDQGRERQTDDDGNGQVHQVAAEQKRFEPFHEWSPSSEIDSTTLPNCSAASSRCSAACTSANG